MISGNIWTLQWGLDFKTKCTSKRMRCYSAESNGDSGKQTGNLNFKYSKLLLFLPAYLLIGFPKTFLTLPILLPPFQHVSKLLLIVASLPAMIGFDTFRNSGRAFDLTSKLSYKVCSLWPITDLPSSKLWLAFTLVFTGEIFPIHVGKLHPASWKPAGFA